MVSALEKFGDSPKAGYFEVQAQEPSQTGECAGRICSMSRSYRDKAYYIGLACFLILTNACTAQARHFDPEERQILIYTPEQQARDMYGFMLLGILAYIAIIALAVKRRY